MSKRFLIGIFALAALLRLGFLWLAPGWYDENFTLLLTRLPLVNMLQAAAGDVHPPLWYLLLWPLGQLHAPIWALRLPAAMLSLGALWLFYRILEELHVGPRIQAAAMLLMAVMPIQLYYAMEARMYSLLEFLVLLALLAMLRRSWGWMGVAGALMLWTQYYGIFYFASVCLCAIRYRSEWRRIILSALLAGISFLPWAMVLLRQMGNVQGTYWMQFTGPGMALRVLFDTLFMPPGNAIIQIPLMLAGFGWLAVALIWAIRRKIIREIWIMAFLPFALAVLVSVLWQPVLLFRSLIGITPFLYILLAAPVEALYEVSYGMAEKPQLRLNLRKTLIAAIFILPLILVTDGYMYAYARADKTSAASLELQYIQANWQPGDVIYHYGDESWVNSQPYSSLPSYRAQDCGITLGALSPATRQAIGMQITPLEQISYRRAWLLWPDSPLTPTCGISQIAALGAPVMVVRENDYVFDGVWLVEK